MLSEKGAPTPVAWTRMRVPRSLMGAIGTDAIAAAAKSSPLQAKYGQTVDRSRLRAAQRPVGTCARDAPLPPARAGPTQGLPAPRER